VFAAFLKLIIPFVIVIPGIIAFNLFSADMQFEAIRDNARVMAKYVKANPNTNVVTVMESPAEDTVATWPSGKFMLAIYKDDATVKALKIRHPFVLPIEREQFNSVQVSANTVFISEDKAWDNLYSQLAQEVEAYNEHVRATALSATSIKTEKFIAYKYDTAMAQLLGKVLPSGVGLTGFVLAALLGAVVSSLAAMLNAASTIFSMDIYQKFLSPKASQKTLVLLGRICVVAFTFVAVWLAPQLGNPKISNSIFTIIQEGQGFISPGILAVFIFGLVLRKAPPVAGVVGLLTNIVAYGGLKLLVPHVQFLNRMAICFVLCLVVMGAITVFKPLAQPVEFKQKGTLELTSSKNALYAGLLVILLTLILYLLFSPLIIAG